MSELYKVGIYNQATQKTLYPQIVEFVIWEGKKNWTIKIQGLQNISGSMVHMCCDGTIQVHVLEGETILFNFGEGWVSAEIKKGLR